MKKRFLPLNIFILAAGLFCVIFTFASAKELNQIIEYYGDPITKADLVCTVDNGNIELADYEIEDNILTIKVKPLKTGSDILEIDDKTTGNIVAYLSYYSGPFDTLFTFYPSFDFQHSAVIIAVIMLVLIVVTVYTTVMYFYFLKRSEFSYSMVACGGIAIFGLVDLFAFLGVLLLSGLNSIEGFFAMPLGFFLQGFAAFGEFFTYITAPFMAVFSIAVSLSNFFLIRKEGFGIFNLLGVILGFLWVAGMVFNMFFINNSSGSSEHGRIFTTISSATSIIISYFICMLMSTVISAWRASRHIPPFDRDYIIILGCAINKDGSPTPLLRGRIDSAIAFARKQFEKTGKRVKFIPSGGQGSDEVISESEAMKRYLLKQDIPEEQILTENRSVNTFQNVLFSKKIIENNCGGDYKSAVSTTSYHVFRSYILAKKVELKNMQGISSKTKWYFFPNAFLRELVGLVVDKKKIHIFLVVLLAAAFALINALTFFG